MRLLASYLATGLMLSSALAFGTFTQYRPADTLAQPLETVPKQIGSWRMVNRTELAPSVAAHLNASSYISRTYTDGKTQLDLFIAYYAVQRAGESMHSPKHCLPGAGWEIWQHGTAAVDWNGNPVQVNRYSIQNGAERASTLYWYQSKDRIMADEYRAKLLLIWDGLTKSRTAGSIVRIISKDNPEGLAKADAFARLIIPEMQTCLGKR